VAAAGKGAPLLGLCAASLDSHEDCGTCHAVVWRSRKDAALLNLEGSVARTPSSEMVAFCGAKSDGCRLFRAATSHRRCDRARCRRAFEGSPNPGCLESGVRTQTIDRRTGTGVARAAHARRFQGGSRGGGQGRRDPVLHSEIWKGGGPACHVVVNASFHLVSPPARKLRQCGACWGGPQQVIALANRSYHRIPHTNVVSGGVCRDRWPCSVASAANNWYLLSNADFSVGVCEAVRGLGSRADHHRARRATKKSPSYEVHSPEMAASLRRVKSSEPSAVGGIRRY
jgi:hypothetical protein